MEVRQKRKYTRRATAKVRKEMPKKVWYFLEAKRGKLTETVSQFKSRHAAFNEAGKLIKNPNIDTVECKKLIQGQDQLKPSFVLYD